MSLEDEGCVIIELGAFNAVAEILWTAGVFSPRMHPTQDSIVSAMLDTAQKIRPWVPATSYPMWTAHQWRNSKTGARVLTASINTSFLLKHCDIKAKDPLNHLNDRVDTGWDL